MCSEHFRIDSDRFEGFATFGTFDMHFSVDLADFGRQITVLDKILRIFRQVEENYTDSTSRFGHWLVFTRLKPIKTERDRRDSRALP